MINARYLIIAAFAVLTLTIISSVLSLMSPNDNQGRGQDSYGVEVYGYRAWFELCEQLKIPVQRLHTPFSAQLPTSSTYLMLTPDADLLKAEQQYLKEMKNWVNAGGRLVICFGSQLIPLEFTEILGIPYAVTQNSRTPAGRDNYSSDLFNRNPEELTAEDIEQEQQKRFRDTLQNTADERLQEDLTNLLLRPEIKRDKISVVQLHSEDGKSVHWNQMKTISDQLFVLITRKSEQLRPLLVTPDVARLLTDAEKSIEIAASGNRLDSAVNPEPQETARPTAEEESAPALQMLAGEYQIGHGELVLISDQGLFENKSLEDSDNTALLLPIVLGDSQMILFDEYYHGLSLRGNMIWVFTQPGYRLITVAFLFAVGLWCWRSYYQLGQVRELEPAPRRTLAAYLAAVAQQLVRTKQQRQQLTHYYSQMTIWRLGRQAGLPTEKLQRDSLLGLWQRRDPAVADTIEELLAEYESEKLAKLSNDQILDLLQRSQRCPY